MARGDGALYNGFKNKLFLGEVDFNIDDIKVILVTAHTPNIDTHTDYFHVVSDEVSGTGYNPGGTSLSGVVVTQQDASDRAHVTADDTIWTSLDADVDIPSHAIMYDNSHADDVLIGYWELGNPPMNGSKLTLAWHDTDGIFTIN
jgi:hypothetical protein